MKLMRGQEVFVNRLYDAMAQCSRRGKPVVTSFLTPAQQQLTKTICKDYVVTFDGGHNNFERAAAIISSDDGPVSSDVVCLAASFDRKNGSLSHKDVLGACMHAGLQREVLGDFLFDESHVYLFCKASIAPFIARELVQIGRHHLAFEAADLSMVPEMESRILQINVSSLRADSVTAALAHCSRSKAMDMIKAGLVKVNDVVLDQNCRLCNNDHISIRRCGRFQFLEVTNTTKKERLVLKIKQYI